MQLYVKNEQLLVTRLVESVKTRLLLAQEKGLESRTPHCEPEILPFPSDERLRMNQWIKWPSNWPVNTVAMLVNCVAEMKGMGGWVEEWVRVVAVGGTDCCN